MFASAGDEERRRRPADLANLVVGLTLLLATALDADDPTELGTDVATFLRDLPDWIVTLLGAGFALSIVYAVAIVVVAVVAHDRPGLVRDLIVGGSAALVLALITGRLVEGEWVALSESFDVGNARYPVVTLALVTALAATASPHLIRPVRHLGYALVAAALTAAVALEYGTFPGAMGGLAIGLVVAALVHLAFGSPAGAPSLARVRAALGPLGIDSKVLRPVEGPTRGPLALECQDGDGRWLGVNVYGRDAADTQLLARSWRLLWYRHSGSASTVTRRHQIEHEALVTLLARRAGATTTDVVATALTGQGDAVFVVTPPFRPAGGPVHLTDAQVGDAWSRLACMRAERIAHGAIDWLHICVGPGDDVTFGAWPAGTAEATPEQLDTDAAALLVVSALAVGTDRAVELARLHLEPDALVTAVPYVQPAALTPPLRGATKDAALDLEELRLQTARGAGADEPPEPVRIQRVTLGKLLMTVLTAVAFWALLTGLSDIGIDALVDAFSDATWGWVILALVVGQTPRIANAFSTLGATPEPLPLGPTTALQFAITFINLAVPSTAARAALVIRYYQKQGIAASKAVTFGAVDSVSGFIVQILILIVTLGFGLSSLSFDLSADNSSSDSAGWILLLAVLIVVGGILALWFVKRLRSWVGDFLHQAREGLRGLRSIRQDAMLFGGNLAAQVLFSITLGICALAYGHNVSLVDLLAINVTVSLFAGFMPIPGGIGVTEAGLTAGLMAAGVPEADAFAAALTYRMVTFYLPPILGWFASRWLTRNDYL